MTQRASAAGYLFGVALLILAAAILLAVRHRAEAPQSAPPAGDSAERPVLLPTAVAADPEAAPDFSAAPLPTRGPREAADAIVWVPRAGGAQPSRRPTIPDRIARAEPPAAPEPPEASVSAGPSPDRVVQTRRFAKFSVSPDQARIFVDGRYVGIADDWDDHGGGRTLEFARGGTHRVRLELPGYRTLRLEIAATPGARDETVDIGDDLKRESKIEFPKIPKPNDRTVGPVQFLVDPPDSQISEGARVLGAASAFGLGSPLRLSGPMVHDLTLTAPGRQPRKIRILVASNADRELAKVKVDLKRE